MEKEMYIDVKNYVREKSGLYYAVMVYKNVKGERKEKWFPTQLPVHPVLSVCLSSEKTAR